LVTTATGECLSAWCLLGNCVQVSVVQPDRHWCGESSQHFQSGIMSLAHHSSPADWPCPWCLDPRQSRGELLGNWMCETLGPVIQVQRHRVTGKLDVWNPGSSPSGSAS